MALNVLFVGRPKPGADRLVRAIAKTHRLCGVVESGLPNTEPRSLMRSVVGGLRGQGSLRPVSMGLGVPYRYTTRAKVDVIGELISEQKIDVGVVSSMAHLLPARVFERARFGFINLHPSPLPEYRGPAPLLWQALNQERRTGLTFHQIDAGEDTGDILAQLSWEVPFGTTHLEWCNTLASASARSATVVLDRLERGEVRPREQLDHAEGFRARNPKKDEKLIEWNDWPLDRVFHALRGSQPIWDHIGLQFPSLPKLDWRVVSRTHGKAHIGARLTSRAVELGHPEGSILIRPRPSLGQARRVMDTLRAR